MTDKKIIIVFSYYGVGGAQRRAVNLANQFVKRGYSVSVVSALGKDGSIKVDNYFDLNEKIDLVIIPEYLEYHENDKSVMSLVRINAVKRNILRGLRVCVRIISPIEKKLGAAIRNIRISESLRTYLMTQPNAIIIHFGFNIFERTWYASRRLGDVIIYAETNASSKYVNDGNYESTEKLIKNANAWVFQTKEQAREHKLENNKNAYVIHNPIMSSLPEPYHGDRKRVVVNFCRLSPQKNILLLIRSFQKLLAEYPEYKLHIYGSPVDAQTVEYKKTLDEYVQSNGLQGNVKLFPFDSNVHMKIRDAAMFVSSSDYEGISNTMIEAMALGLPCICTDCGGGGAREIIEDGVNGVLIPVGDETALYQAMKLYIDDPQLASRYGKKAEEVKTTLSVQRIADEWEKVIETVK